MLALGLSTFAERRESTRSDCPAWSASPNYSPFADVCGITPLRPGFKKVRIAPELGGLEFIDAEMPHPDGKIKVVFKREGEYLTGTIDLPPGLDGEFTWQCHTLN
jgi:alpha-L-rhamnosidase